LTGKSGFTIHSLRAPTQALTLTLPGSTDVPPVNQNDDLKFHTDNWFQCMRSRKVPNGSIETGFAHSVAVIMATRSYREGKKMYWDRNAEEIVERAPVTPG
jgi:hypothetical protein